MFLNKIQVWSSNDSGLDNELYFTDDPIRLWHTHTTKFDLTLERKKTREVFKNLKQMHVLFQALSLSFRLNCDTRYE